MNPIFLPQKLPEGGMCPYCGEEDFNKLKEENARKAKVTADNLYPNEKWIKKYGDNIFLSPRRKTGKDTNFIDELRDAKILTEVGSTVYLSPESKQKDKRQFDAIVNGLEMEFKNTSGNANTLEGHFLKSRSQAKNVFLNLEDSSLTRNEIMSALMRARNSITHTNSKGEIIKGYDDSNSVGEGGLIILKLNNHNNLIYLDVEDLVWK